MKKLEFIQIQPENEENCRIFTEMMVQYAKELDAHQQRSTPAALLEKWTASIIRMQGPPDRHLELCEKQLENP